MQKLKVNDTVQVMAGKERTAPKERKRGKILSIDREGGRVTVEGLRMVKRHTKKGRDRANPDGGILEKAGSIAFANVSLVCPKCDQATRVGIKLDGEKKVRFCKKCDAVID
ncbi:MAG TPA: 50S ribosomal protein L24 [Myxococcales bacterium]|nr:50S ribosomal protein L24 [Myxococcales bacterium]